MGDEAIGWTFRALGQFAQLSRTDLKQANRVIQALEALALNGRGDIKKLQGSELWRLRVGDWRVIFRQAKGDDSIQVMDVVLRRDAYD